MISRIAPLRRTGTRSTVSENRVRAFCLRKPASLTDHIGMTAAPEPIEVVSPRKYIRSPAQIAAQLASAAANRGRKCSDEQRARMSAASQEAARGRERRELGMGSSHPR
jgi:hypothetical protein